MAVNIAVKEREGKIVDLGNTQMLRTISGTGESAPPVVQRISEIPLVRPVMGAEPQPSQKKEPGATSYS